jgi:beta-glucanase (GH16 family)
MFGAWWAAARAAGHRRSREGGARLDDPPQGVVVIGESGRRKRAILRSLAFAVAMAATAALAASPAAAQTGTLVFDDEFSGSTVSAPWTPPSQGAFAPGQCWLNDARHVSESGGYSSLTATYEGPNGGACGTGYESGAIQVLASTWSYLYGTAEARIKVPCQSGMGLWPSFWQYASQDPTNDLNGEIDSMEMLSAQWSGGLQNAVTQAIHGSGLPTDRTAISWQTTNRHGVPWCGAFHVFGNTWTSTSVRFTIDGVTEHTVKRSQFSAWPLVTPQAPVLSMLVGQFGGNPTPATFPQTMLVDWVRIWH